MHRCIVFLYFFKFERNITYQKYFAYHQSAANMNFHEKNPEFLEEFCTNFDLYSLVFVEFWLFYPLFHLCSLILTEFCSNFNYTDCSWWNSAQIFIAFTGPGRVLVKFLWILTSSNSLLLKFLFIQPLAELGLKLNKVKSNLIPSSPTH